MEQISVAPTQNTPTTQAEKKEERETREKERKKKNTRQARLRTTPLPPPPFFLFFPNQQQHNKPVATHPLQNTAFRRRVMAMERATWLMALLLLCIVRGKLDVTLSHCDTPEQCAWRARFLAWCRERGIEGGVGLDWRARGAAGGGGGMFARENAKVAALGRVPLEATLSVTGLAERERWRAPLGGDLAALASFVAFERFVRGCAGFFGPYVCVLPRETAWAPCMWSREEMEFVREVDALLYGKVEAERRLVQQEFAQVHAWALREPGLWLNATITEEQYCWARAHVGSRFFFVQTVDKEGKLVQLQLLVPFLDLFNHKGSANNPLHYDAVEDGAFVIYMSGSAAHVAQGEEVFITYGINDADAFLVHLGFVSPECAVGVPVALAPGDPLLQLKRAAIAQCWPDEDPVWVKMPLWGVPSEVLARAQIIVERRANVLENATALFCSGANFAQRDVESLRRNKRALLYIWQQVARSARASLPRPEQSVNERNVAHLWRLQENARRTLLDRFQSNAIVIER